MVSELEGRGVMMMFWRLTLVRRGRRVAEVGEGRGQACWSSRGGGGGCVVWRAKRRKEEVGEG